MTQLSVLIKGDLNVSGVAALEVLKEIIIKDQQLAHQDLCFAVLTSFPFTSMRPFENVDKRIFLAEATVGQFVKWERAKFFQDFLEATELHRWDYNTISLRRVIDGVSVYITLVGTACYSPKMYDETFTMETGRFHWFCAHYHEDGDAKFVSTIREPFTQVYVVPEPDPFPPKPPVTYQEALEATHAPLSANPHQPADPEPTHWADRLIAYFKGKGKKHV